MTGQTSHQGDTVDRVVRVFVSSTFHDMQEERRVLATHVFPELRQRCRERNVDFVEVDLRWGITPEQAERGGWLPICLSEVERCRFCFIALLGDLYGTPCRNEVSYQLLERWPWLQDYLDKSGTELEIIRAALISDRSAERCFFYLRDPAYVNQLPYDCQKEFEAQNADGRKKLDSLKRRIRVAASDKRDFRLTENYPDARALGGLILAELWESIEKQFPKDSQPDSFQQEGARHEAFAARRTQIYVARGTHFRHLDEHVEGNGLPLVIVGESGIGKSALVANWTQHYCRIHPGDSVIVHFLGSSSNSTDPVQITSRILREIKKRCRLSEEVPRTPEQLIEALPLWLARTVDAGRLVLILDGLNQLEGHSKSLDLRWLPELFPPHVRVVLSTAPGASLTVLRDRGWPELKLAGLDSSERVELVTRYLGLYGKKLKLEQLDRVCAGETSSYPIFLMALLHELCVTASFEELDKRIDHYVQASSVEDLFQRILARWEQDYDSDRSNLVRDAHSFLWAAREGLSENELLELLGTSEGPLAHAVWSPLHVALDESLVDRSGLMGFFHNHLRNAVELRYLSNTEKQQSQHNRLADYFERRELGERTADEYPWQVLQCRQWQRLKNCLTNMGMFKLLNTELRQNDLNKYWLALEGECDMGQAYEEALDELMGSGIPRHEVTPLMALVGEFLQYNGRLKPAQRLLEKVLAKDMNSSFLDQRMRYLALSNLASVYHLLGDNSRAAEHLIEALRLQEERLGPNHGDLCDPISRLMPVLEQNGDYNQAEELCQRAITISEEHWGPNHVDTLVHKANFAALIAAKRDFNGAAGIFQDVLKSARNFLGSHHPLTAQIIGNKGMLHAIEGKHQEAVLLLEQALKIRKEIFGEVHSVVAESLLNLGGLFADSKDWDRAKEFLSKALTIQQKTLGPDHPDQALTMGNLGLVAEAQGDLDGAEKLYREALRIKEKALGPNHVSLADTLIKLATLRYELGDLEEAENTGTRALVIRQRSGSVDVSGITANLDFLAILKFHQQDHETALALLRQGLRIQWENYGPNHPKTIAALDKLVALLAETEQYEEACSVCNTALEIRQELLGSDHTDTIRTRGQLAYLLHEVGRTDEAASLLSEALNAGDGQDVESLVIMAGLMDEKGDLREAQNLLRRAIELSERVSGSDHPETLQLREILAELLDRCQD